MNKQSPHFVFIPGFMLNESLWDDMFEYFPEHWNIHKASLEEGHSIEKIVENIVKNAPKKFILIGFSLGGYIARFLINQYPERVSALILIASSIRLIIRRKRSFNCRIIFSRLTILKRNKPNIPSLNKIDMLIMFINDQFILR